MPSDLQSGFQDLEDELKEYLAGTDDAKITETLKIGAEEFKADLGKLASPRSRINKGGYTHILDTFAVRQEDTGWLVGWGKYYGPILESGWKNAGTGHSSSHAAIPHFRNCFNQNRDRYYKDMIANVHM